MGPAWVSPTPAPRVEVRLPEPVPPDRLRAEGYTGPQGAQGQAYAAELAGPGAARWRLTAPLAPYEGLTIVLSFPRGIVAAPGPMQRAGWLLADNRGILVALAGVGGRVSCA